MAITIYRCECKQELALDDTMCPACGRKDFPLPNVRRALDPIETGALKARYKSAYAASRDQGTTRLLAALLKTASGSKAVKAMGIATLHVNLLNKDLIKSFYRRGSRINTQDPHSLSRETSDTWANPGYHHLLVQAALSANELGCRWYGSCHLVFRSESIASRASVFWENPRTLFAKVSSNDALSAPPGHRATWENRSRLAIAKLHDRIQADTRCESFSALFIEPRIDPTSDFIEVQIYGDVAISAVEKITICKETMDDTDLESIDVVVRKLAGLKIESQVIDAYP
ncbi:hypothetical protein HA461_25845 (plasmid) [Rhizobium leguminosarum bv. trifolii]|uniref:hypothetical protein n=1 Tax=Rhizobium leguminosarum TaxID=384 RepID=UPI00140FF5D8|nr:hypothetical protein [Rhizobium leguminosarum]QIO54612.1 hypothetical protein HA461_25845 [Rhizobium leguminosarum bv. trifolii]